MRRYSSLLAALLIIGCCSKLEGEGWQKLPDGSFGRVQPASQGNALNNVERCWPAGNMFDCVSITRQQAPALMVLRQIRSDYRSDAGAPPHYACRFDPDFTVWYDQLISRQDVRKPDQVDRRNRISRTNYTVPWSKRDVERIAGEEGVPAPFPYVNCTHLNDMILLGGVEMLVRSNTDLNSIAGD